MPEFIILLLTLTSGVVQFWLVIVSLQQRQHAGLQAFRVLVFTGAVWAASYVAQLITQFTQPDAPPNLWAYIMQGLSGLMPAAYLLLMLQFTIPPRYARYRGVSALIYAFPVASLMLMLGIGLARPWTAAQNTFALWLPVHMTYAYIAMLVGIMLALRQITLAGRNDRQQFIVLAIVGFIPLFTELIQVMVLTLTGRWLLELTPASSGLAALIGARFVFKMNWLDVIPAAYERVVLNMTEGVIVLDEQGVIHACNDAAQVIVGLPHTNDLVGHTLQEVCVDRPALLAALNQLNGHLQRVAHDDATLEVSSQPLLDERHERMGTLITLRDVTAQVQAEETRLKLELEHQQLDFVRDFLGDISHDFFTSLTVVNTYTTLADRLAVNTKQSEYLAHCKIHANRLETMVRNMLTIVRLNQEALEAEDLEEIAVETLVQRALKRWEPDIQHKRQQLVLNLPPENCTLSGEPRQLELALSNVVENAVGYTPDGGTITVTVAPTATHVRIIISDTGVGIAREDQPHIFERFYRADKHRPANASSGLGLPIAKRVVEGHKGSIAVRSTPGEGSTFIITLPLTRPELVVY